MVFSVSAFLRFLPELYRVFARIQCVRDESAMRTADSVIAALMSLPKRSLRSYAGI